MQDELKSVTYFRNFVFGVEDSLVSTVGLLSGIAAASVSKSVILITGTVLIFVEAFSMGAGSFLSEHSAEDYIYRGSSNSRKPGVSSIIMFFSYLISGLIPLVPYIILPIKYALWISILLSLVFLFVLGVISGKVTKTGISKSALRMFVVGGIAILIGALVGKTLHELNN